VIASEYRGSTGYGPHMYEWIDYGGPENDDTYEARNWALERYPFMVPNRGGVVGWSPGGMHALFNIVNWPDALAAHYAGVSVGDLIARMGYKRPEYQG